MEKLKPPQEWAEVVSFHLLLKECGDLGGKFPGGPWYLGALISGERKAISHCQYLSSDGGGDGRAGDGSSTPGPSLVKMIR